MTPKRTIRCEITQLELGAELEDANRYAETVAGRLEIVCEALETIGLHRRAEEMRTWLARWLRVVDLIFEERLAQQSLLALPSNPRALPDADVTRALPETSVSRALPETSVSRALPETSVSRALPETSVSRALPETSVTRALSDEESEKLN